MQVKYCMRKKTRTSQKSEDSPLCWCDSGCTREACCGPVLEGLVQPVTALALMRSRYSASATRNVDYLKSSWHPATRPAGLQLSDEQRWLGLKIVGVEAGAPNDTVGTVEFVARYKVNGRGFRLHEHSRFERVDGRWFYVDGQIK